MCEWTRIYFDFKGPAIMHSASVFQLSNCPHLSERYYDRKNTGRESDSANRRR